jgi:hypothetical protein
MQQPSFLPGEERKLLLTGTHELVCVSRFLIKYVSRDEVELLAQGDNGAPEMREHLANEPDDAPLFGYIRFRRKNVLVKYIPEAASRVIKGTYSDIKMRKEKRGGRWASANSCGQLVAKSTSNLSANTSLFTTNNSTSQLPES